MAAWQTILCVQSEVCISGEIKQLLIPLYGQMGRILLANLFEEMLWGSLEGFNPKLYWGI